MIYEPRFSYYGRIGWNPSSRSFSDDLLTEFEHSMEEPMQAKKPNPYNKREVKDEKKAFGRTSKTVKPVAKDTNKTRRKIVKPTKGGNK